MVLLISISESDRADKKLKAVFLQDNGRTRTIHFGAKRNGIPMDDYTLTHDIEQRSRYLTRHANNETWNNPMTAGALSRFILWGDSTDRVINIHRFKKRFNI